MHCGILAGHMEFVYCCEFLPWGLEAGLCVLPWERRVSFGTAWMLGCDVEVK